VHSNIPSLVSVYNGGDALTEPCILCSDEDEGYNKVALLYYG